MDTGRLFSFREQDDVEKPFLDHLADLRAMLIRMTVVIVAAMSGAFFFRGFLAGLLQRPLVAVDPARANSLQSLGVADSMTISIEISFYAGIILSFPLLMGLLAQFLFPALKPSERRILLPVSVFGLLLFLSGILFAYLVVLPRTLDFFFNDAKSMHLSLIHI